MVGCGTDWGHDPAFAVISLVAFVLFLGEMAVNCYSVPGYWQLPQLVRRAGGRGKRWRDRERESLCVYVYVCVCVRERMETSFIYK